MSDTFKGLTFEQLGERVGISKGTVSKIFSEEDENGNPAFDKHQILRYITGRLCGFSAKYVI